MQHEFFSSVFPSIYYRIKLAGERKKRNWYLGAMLYISSLELYFPTSLSIVTFCCSIIIRPSCSMKFIHFFCGRDACESNEHHDGEIDSARVAAEKDVAKNSEEVVQHIDCKFMILTHIVSKILYLSKPTTEKLKLKQLVLRWIELVGTLP